MMTMMIVMIVLVILMILILKVKMIMMSECGLNAMTRHMAADSGAAGGVCGVRTYRCSKREK
jgi:hypothetical protein